MATDKRATRAPPAMANAKQTAQGFPRPTCPTVMIPHKLNGQTKMFALPLVKLDITMECNVSTTFVHLVGTWQNMAKYNADCIFSLPTIGTVTGCRIVIKGKGGGKSRLLETVVVPNTVMQELSKIVPKAPSSIPRPSGPFEGGGEVPQDLDLPEGKLPPMDFEKYEPGMFRLPITNFGPGEVAKVTVDFIQPLKFIDGSYRFNLPLKFSKDLLYRSETYAADLNQVMSLNCTINSPSDAKIRWVCRSHDCMLRQQQRDLTSFQVDFRNPKGGQQAMQQQNQEGVAKAGPISYDFTLEYAFERDEILPALVVKAASGEGSQEGHFMLFVTPPSKLDRKVMHAPPRDVIFLLDKSGSMTGRPFEEAKRAIAVALKALHKQDRFNVCAFDHLTEYFVDRKNNLVVPASPENIAMTESWLMGISPNEGGTEIKKPLVDAIQDLNTAGTALALEGKAQPIPFVVLVTDGCVEDERDICRSVKAIMKKHRTEARILTFGIGSYSNWYFLKLLAELGRGFTDVAVFMDYIYEGMTNLIGMAGQPVLTNLRMKANVEKMTVYPFPIPDLFAEAPVNIAGNYQGNFPQSIELVGNKPETGEEVTFVVKASTSNVIPVDKVFIKQRLDLLTARAWLEQSDEEEAKVVNLSVENSMPSAYTTMVAYEVTEETKRAMDEAEKDKKDEKTKEQLKNVPAWYKNKKALAAVAGAGVVAVGAIAFSFGDAAATGMNAGMLGEVVFGAGGGCCDDPGECMDCVCNCVPV